MRRVVHELSGLAQRFGQLAQQMEDELEATQASWRDQRGEAFMRENLAPFKPRVSQLVACIQETHEMFDALAKRLADPDLHN